VREQTVGEFECVFFHLRAAVEIDQQLAGLNHEIRVGLRTVPRRILAIFVPL